MLSVKICVRLWLSSAAFLQKRSNQLHSLSLFRARAKLRHVSLHPADPVRTRRRSGNIEAVFARKQVGDHYYRDPRFTVEELFHHRGIKIAFEIDVWTVWSETAKSRDLLQFGARLIGCRPGRHSRFGGGGCWMLKRFLP